MKQLVLLLIILGISVCAQDFNAELDRNPVPQSQSFRITFTFSGGDANNVKNFTPPDFRGFDVLSGPSQSTSMQWVNGKFNSSISFTYVLQKTETGDYTIYPATITYEGKQLKTDPVKVTITKGSARPQQNASSDLTGQELAENLFLRAIPDKTTAYKGEQITITFKIYTRLNISDFNVEKLPAFQGFWSEQLEIPKNPRLESEMYNGIKYSTAVLYKIALFPNQTGKLSVTPLELKIPVTIPKKKTRSVDPFDSFFDDPFFGRSERVLASVKSNEIIINSLPLPENGAPESFNGNVGDFKIKIDMPITKMKVNETFSLKIAVEGKGNISLLSIPEPEFPEGIEKYEPKTQDNIDKTNIINGTKTVEYLLIPRTPGKNIIEGIRFSYFNPQTRKYTEVKTDDISIDVTGTASDFASSAAIPGKEDIRMLNRDIRFIKTSDLIFKRKSDKAYFQNWFTVGAIFSLSAFAVFVLLMKRKEKLSANISELRYRKAEKAARKRLKEAEKSYVKGDYTSFYSEISKAVAGYLEDKLGLRKSEFTVENVKSLLLNKGVKTDLAAKVIEIIDKCEFARFAPSSVTRESSIGINKETIDLLIELEDAIKGK